MDIKKQSFFLAVNTGFVSNGLPDEDCIEFYKARSGKGIGCSIVGNVVISGGYATNNVCSMISKDKVWVTLATSITNNGSIAGIQLSSTWPDYTGNKKFVATQHQNPIEDYKVAVSQLSFLDIELILTNLKNSIEISIDAGFKHIQIHAAHGYLFSLLIDPFFSKHSEYFLGNIDKIAGNLKSRKIQSSIRFSLLTGSQKLDKNRSPLIERIMETKFDFFDVSFGFYNINKNLIYPETNSALKSRRLKTLELAKKFPNRNFIISGKVKLSELHNFPDNIYLGVCRDLIANPNYILQSNFGCLNCGDCHYYSKGKSRLECGVAKI
ncbi:hypothetical protein H5154_14630 [Pseudoalteromonas sp. SR44-5]|uniref:oxidoreductase n=1 Tax=Pseudoalteromonas sp. SR44-5 TaxID=2760934 RepID=UPI00160138B4|nr:hypothetical protein [Pseudoalteromonas sp. SR44-5]MBB1367616.1 hypothetical protein [Pseudoalteromonas sp. SR44-5]